MRLLNFSHPLNDEQQQQLEKLLGTPLGEVIAEMPQIDDHAPLPAQITALVDSIALSAPQWQMEPIIVVLPGLAVAAGCLLAELHGRMGYFPAIVRLTPRPNSPVRLFDVTEVIDLAGVRERARMRRA